MPDHRQKKLARHKKKRAAAPRRNFVAESRQYNEAAETLRILSAVASAPMGPCLISRGWQDEETQRVHCVLVTHVAPGNDEFLVPAAFLVDLGCFGLRDALLMSPVKADAMSELQATCEEMFPQGFEPISPAGAAKVVFSALDYGRSLGFGPKEKVLPILGLLTEELDPELTVPLGRHGKPLYEPSEGEDTRPVVKKLVQAVGPDGFEVVMPQQCAAPQP